METGVTLRCLRRFNGLPAVEEVSPGQQYYSDLLFAFFLVAIEPIARELVTLPFEATRGHIVEHEHIGTSFAVRKRPKGF